MEASVLLYATAGSFIATLFLAVFVKRWARMTDPKWDAIFMAAIAVWIAIASALSARPL
jgi:hypothetical protein